LLCGGSRPNLANAADRADAIFAARTHPDDPISGAAFTTEGNVDAHGPQEGLSPAKAAGECAGIVRPTGVCSENAIIC
jgi:hypothetical protein